MRNLLSTSALIAPFLVGMALAQDAPTTSEPADPPADEQLDTLPETETDPEDTDLEEPDLDAPDTEEPDLDSPDTEEADPALEPEPDMDQPEDAEMDPAPETDLETDEPADAAEDAVEPTEPTATEDTGDTIVQEQAQNELRVDWITGTTVNSRQEERIGSIQDLIIDQDTNTITAAILSVGGFLGIGAKQIAVRFDELEIDFDAREIYLDMTRDEADEAPEYVFRERTEAPAPAVDTGTTGAPAAPLD